MLHIEDDLDLLRSRLVDAGEPVAPRGRKDDVHEHFRMLECGFSGRAELELLHAKVIVLIRRQIEYDFHVALFRRIWLEQGAFLLKNLDSRWLVSACDTVVDTSDDPAEVAAAFAGSLFMGTIKLYETERLGSDAGPAYPNFPNASIALFDGMTRFTRRGDLVYNLDLRISRWPEQSFVVAIVRELYKRAKQNDTIYKRVQAMQSNEQ